MTAPPGYMPDIRMGGSTAPLKNDLIAAGRLILDNCGVSFGNRRLFRLVDEFKERAPRAGGWVFFQYLAATLELTNQQKLSALSNPDVVRAISYADPTGEQAVNNVMRKQ